MRRSHWRWRLTSAATGLGLLALAVVPVHANPDDPSAVSHQAANTPEAVAAVLAFWTPERMRQAVPMEIVVANLPAGQQIPQTWPTPSTAQAPANHGGPWTGSGEVVKTTGRVFFTFEGKEASCSGSAVTSANKSVVITAGHCVRMKGTWHPDWLFVPAYDNGNAPHGKWAARQLHTTPQWVDKEELNFDVGAAVLNQLDGKNLTDVVGAQEIAFNQPRNQHMHAFGYPAAAPYDGTRLIFCSGQTFTDFLLTRDHGMRCNQTGGSSGGPWFLRFDEATGKGAVNSVNSFKYGIISFLMFGPYFGAEAQAVYDAAQKG
ncbi:serine protease [Kibdelosporangium persicum]|uniref:Extracellular metalloprotease n=1 Tax=Kibdelosporangium persicum TaxID=2698649 RepID=A0ABX2F7J1_9PSEU|nr:peptidase [Kibdelosporangium persicum]NRN67158.1 Extracellular metalloprotease [Kibdelosporangium persicum]